MRYRVPIANAVCSQQSWARPVLSRQRRSLQTSRKTLPELHGGEVDTTNTPEQNPAVERERLEDGISDTTQLPLSPLMDPEFQAARNRYRTPKPEASAELSAFQRKLRKNPYAQALATPLRQCPVTGARLPNFFLLDFGLVPHPQTGKPWQMPKLVIESGANVSSSASIPDGAELNVTGSNKVDTPIDAPSSHRRPARTVAGSHIIAHQSALRLISNLKQRSYMQILPHRWKNDARFKADQIIWRKDMDTFVLELLRKRAVKLLQYLGTRPAAYVVPCQDYEDIQNKHQAGAVLWLGGPNADKDHPPPYAMMGFKSSGRIPLYNLPALLGSEHLSQLRGASKIFDSTLAVIKRKHNTAECQLHLWKLMGYVASDTSAG